MNIYLISQRENNGYDTYSDMVVVAKDEEEARNIHPREQYMNIEDQEDPWEDEYSGWCRSPNKVTVEIKGRAIKGMKKGIILTSFHAG